MMLRKFECWHCHHRFEADESSWVECPHCHSDNVDYARFHLPKGIWKWGVGVVSVAVLAYALLNVDWKMFKGSEAPQAVIAEVEDTARKVIEETDTAVVHELRLPVPPTVNVKGNPVFKDGGYSFDVTVKNAPQEGSYYVVALDHFNHSVVVARSKNGHFDQLPPSKADGGQYDFAVCAVSNDSMLCQPVPRAGFIPQQSVARRMNKEQLQQLIDSNDDSLYGAGENKFIAPDCEIAYEGLPADAPDVPTKLKDVADKVDVGNWEATVKHTEYDDLNRISKVVIVVKVKE